jgi:hypothetical protein
MRSEITLTDDQIEARFEELQFGCCVEDLTFTRDTIEDFTAAANGYASHGAIESETLDTGEACLVIEDAQARAGATRADVVVVDFGAVRAVYQ